MNRWDVFSGPVIQQTPQTEELGFHRVALVAVQDARKQRHEFVVRVAGGPGHLAQDRPPVGFHAVYNVRKPFSRGLGGQARRKVDVLLPRHSAAVQALLFEPEVDLLEGGNGSLEPGFCRYPFRQRHVRAQLKPERRVVPITDAFGIGETLEIAGLEMIDPLHVARGVGAPGK